MYIVKIFNRQGRFAGHVRNAYGVVKYRCLRDAMNRAREFNLADPDGDLCYSADLAIDYLRDYAADDSNIHA